MKEHPILFQTEMVKAILEGSKTQTRRIVKGYALEFLNDGFIPSYILDPGNTLLHKYEVGDVLWVRETFRPSLRGNGDGYDELIEYKEGTKALWQHPKDYDNYSNWRPSIFMPKSASRIRLEITDISVERLQDISEEDAIAEGIQFYKSDISQRNRYKDYLTDASGHGNPEHDYPEVGVAVTSYSTLWRKINGEDSWWANPWVWAITFKTL